MQFLTAALCFAPLLSGVFAAPMPADAAPAADSSLQAAAAHPAMQTMQDIATLLGDILPKINNFDGTVAAMNDLERDAQNALRALQVGIQKLNSNPEMGLGDAIAFGPVTGNLISGAYKMTSAFGDNKAKFKRTPAIALETYRILDDTYIGIDQMQKAFVEKLPPGISFMVNVFVNRGLMNNIKGLRDDFKPEGYGEEAQPQYTLPPQYQQQQQPRPQQQQQQQQQQQPSYPAWQAPNQAQPQYQQQQQQQQQYQPAGQYQQGQQQNYQQAQPQYQYQQQRPRPAATS